MTEEFPDTAQYGNYSEEGLFCDSSIHVHSAEVVRHWIELAVHPILLLQGTVGNMLAIPVLVSMSRSSWSTITYLALLGVTDLIILLIRCGDRWYSRLMEVSLAKQLMDSSDAVCRTYQFLFTFVRHLSPWLTVALSVEMMIATRWPKKTYIMCTLERARYVLMLITIILVCLDINLFWTFGVRKSDTGCLYNEEFSEVFRDWIWPALENMVELLLPLMAVSFCFFLTATTMIRRPVSREKDLELEMKKYFIELTTLRDFRTVSLVMCLIFMCLTTTKVTLSVMDLIVQRSTYLELDCLAAHKLNSVLKLLWTIDMAVTYIFYGTKIYLYLALSATFRTRLRSGFVYLAQKIRTFSKSVFHCGRRWMPISLQEKRGTPTSLRLDQEKALLLRANHQNHGPSSRLAGEEASNTNTSLFPEGSYQNVAKGGRGNAGIQHANNTSTGNAGLNEGDHIPMQEVGTKV